MPQRTSPADPSPQEPPPALHQRLGFLLELWEAFLHKAFTHDLRRHSMAGRYEVMYDVYDMYIYYI